MIPKYYIKYPNEYKHHFFFPKFVFLLVALVKNSSSRFFGFAPRLIIFRHKMIFKKLRFHLNGDGQEVKQ